MNGMDINEWLRLEVEKVGGPEAMQARFEAIVDRRPPTHQDIAAARRVVAERLGLDEAPCPK